MVAQYLAEDLLRSIRLKNPLANVGSTGSKDSDLLMMVNEAIWQHLVPRMMKLSEEYFTLKERVSIGANSSVRIPHRAIYQKLRHLYLVGSSGSRVRINPIQKEELNEAVFQTSGYYIEGNEIVIHPSASAGLSDLEMHYMYRPGELVLSTECRQIVDVDYATNTVEVTSEVPAEWTDDLLYDIHSGKSGAEIEMFDLEVSSIGPGTSDTIIFTVPLDGSLFGTRPVLIGDWVCLAETAALPGIPRELHPQIANAVALQIAVMLKDTEAIKIHGEMLKGALGEAAGALEQRVEGHPAVITGRKGILWAGRRW